MEIRKSEDRGHVDHGWLFARHSFSFSNYYDDRYLGFRELRVINEDIVQGGEGFPMHPHKSMEILTYILEGALEHKDSMNNHGVIRPGGVQYMSAGSGVVHSEFNASKSEPVHLLQIWILPSTLGGPPNYGQKEFKVRERKNHLVLLASPDGSEDSIVIRQNARLSAAIFDGGLTVTLPLPAERHGWLQMAKGRVRLNGQELKAGDGASFFKDGTIALETLEESEFLWFDLS